MALAQVLDGKKTAEVVYSELKSRVGNLSVVPKQVFILVGNHPASETYVASKEKRCRDLGFTGETLRLPDTVSQKEVLAVVSQLNADPKVHGILIQLPLPKHLNANELFSHLDPKKDVDCLHPENVGLMFQGRPRFLPCTPSGVIRLLKQYQIAILGKHAVVLGRSEIVGKPLALLLLQENATVTICHSKTQNLEMITQSADILCAAVGIPEFVRERHVKPGAVVVDVGIHRTGAGLVGDVHRGEVLPKVQAITPVPGGVGPMTIAMLMENVMRAALLG